MLLLLIMTGIIYAQNDTTKLTVYPIICCHLKGYSDTTGLLAVTDSAVVLDMDGESDGSLHYNQGVILIESSLIGNCIYLKEKKRQRVRIEFADKRSKKAFLADARKKKFARMRNYKWLEYPVYGLNAGILILVLISPFLSNADI